MSTCTNTMREYFIRAGILPEPKQSHWQDIAKIGAVRRDMRTGEIITRLRKADIYRLNLGGVYEMKGEK